MKAFSPHLCKISDSLSSGSMWQCKDCFSLWQMSPGKAWIRLSTFAVGGINYDGQKIGRPYPAVTKNCEKC